MLNRNNFEASIDIILLVIPRIDPNKLAIKVPIPSANIASLVG
jgi:hypothetical protein